VPNELVLSVSQSLPAPPPTAVFLGSVLVAPYQSIRVLADCRSSATGHAIVTLRHLEGEGAPGVLDRFTLTPGASINQVYDVPGVILGVSAAPAGDADTSVDVYIWGFRTDADGVPPEPNVPGKVDGTLTVQVVESDGSTAGADIEILFDGVFLGLTGPDGSLSVTRIESEYTVVARHPDGRTSEPVGVQIVGDESSEVTITLPAP
jgi:hypothetical protein